MGDIIVCSNLTKWTMITPQHYDMKLVSKSFTIRNRTCKFEYYSGRGTSTNHPAQPNYSGRRSFTNYPVQPARFCIDFDIKRSFKTPVPVTILVSSSRQAFNPERCYVTGENNQTIWSTRSPSDFLNTSMTLEMVIHVLKEDKSVQTGSYLNAEVTAESSYEDFSKLLDAGTGYDAEIKCGGHTIKVHRFILSARSEVLSKMFQSHMKEARSGIIKIKDMDISYLQDFVRYLYTGAMPELNFEKAKILYEVGDKYAVRSLMIRCSEYLQDNLSPENFGQCFALADAHSDQNMRDGILTYMLEENVYLQEELWIPFCESFPKVANEVYRLSYKRKISEIDDL